MVLGPIKTSSIILEKQVRKENSSSEYFIVNEQENNEDPLRLSFENKDKSGKITIHDLLCATRIYAYFHFFFFKNRFKKNNTKILF